MLHPHRRFCVTTYADPTELAEKITEYSWTLCTGFEYQDLLFLNDSFSEDGAQEYAVVRNGRQIESITFGWCNKARAAELIKEVSKINGDPPMDIEIKDLRIDNPPERHGVCHLCQ